MTRRPLLAIAILGCASGCGVLLAAQADPPATVPDPDGSTTGDATSADGNATEGDASACNSRFCSDFDPPSDAFPWSWSETPTLPLGMGLTSDASTTPPNALDITNDVGATSFLALVIPVATLKTRWSFDYRVLTTGTMTDLDLFDLDCTDATGVINDTVKVKIKGDSHKIKLQTNGGGSSEPIDFGDTGVFVSIAVEIEGDRARLIIGTTPAELAVTCPQTGKHTVRLGVVDNGASVWRLQIDHVRGDWL